jgi:hypothetical protein
VPLPIAGLFSDFVFKPVLRPVIRFICGLIAIPLFRLILKRVCRVETRDEEMERDLEGWFRGAILLLAATANMEAILFGWISLFKSGDSAWITLLPRLLLAVGVIESMPDEDVFSILHRGPPKLKLTTRAGWREAWRRRGEMLRGLGVLHLRRSSPVFVIMAVVIGDEQHDREHTVGWWCYGLAITQYLIIALITQRDKFAGLLDAFDRQADAIRSEISFRGAGASAVVSTGEDETDPNIKPANVD